MQGTGSFSSHDSSNWGLQETEAEHVAKWTVMFRRSIFHPPTPGLVYPRPEHRSQHFQKLQLTPSTARELVLLAELVGWAPYLPIMLDMATRPDDRSHINYTHTDGWSYALKDTWGGFKALQVLSGELRSFCNARNAGDLTNNVSFATASQSRLEDQAGSH